MADHGLENRPDQQFMTRIKNLEDIVAALRSPQVQGNNALQLNYTPDSVLAVSVAPSADTAGPHGASFGVIGTFLCTLTYESPAAGQVVIGDLDIQVNQGTDDDAHALSFYYEGLIADIYPDLALTKQLFPTPTNYVPVVRIVRLFTFASNTTSTFYIHTRWRYLGLGNAVAGATTAVLP